MQHKILRKATSKEESLLQKKILPKATNEKRSPKKLISLEDPRNIFGLSQESMTRVSCQAKSKQKAKNKSGVGNLFFG